MPLINRIEVSNFMNRRREDPWRPDWTLQVFELGGWNAAINMPNGGGKSTIVHTILATLAADKSMSDVRKRHFAPLSTGHYSHVRIETYIRVDDESPVDLVVQGGGDAGGYPMVIGVYGNSGETGTWRVYAYQGTLEDCPVGRKVDNRVTLIGNAAFLEKLSVMPGCFPATQREATRSNWREYVSTLFDMPGIEQQLVYQKAKGAEGSSGYFDANPGRGDFSEAVFYERLAPELLVDMMSSFEEYSDERGIEDTIHQKVQGIIKAKARTARTADDLEKTSRLLGELRRIQVKADDVESALASASRAIAEYSLQHAALRAIAVENPVPGIPTLPPDDAPTVVRSMVMQGGEWYLPDRGFEVLTGDKPSAINQRADRQRIRSEAATTSQVIDFYCDLKPTADRGHPSRLYRLDAALALLAATTHFTGRYTRETAIESVAAAFAWATQHGDTNPARIELLKVKDQERKANATRGDMALRRNALNEDSQKLREEQQRIGEQQSEYRRMVQSGLFSERELAAPGETGRSAHKEFDAAERQLVDHREKEIAARQVFNDWLAFTGEHGADADPAEFAAMLESTLENAEIALQENGLASDEAKQRAKHANGRAKEQGAAYEALAKVAERLQQRRPLAEVFTALFPNENPVGLAQRAVSEHQDTLARCANIQVARARMSEPLVALEAFRATCGAQSIPDAWLHARSVERDALMGEVHLMEGDLRDLETRRKDLDQAVVAPGKVAREVLSLAGDDTQPLHAVIERMALPDERKASVLSMFSALLFSPVYEDAERAAQVARDLAQRGIEAPVFVAAELANFCLTAEIEWDGAVAKTWLIGVRTRPVDCLLDPSLVEREKRVLDERVSEHRGQIEARKKRIAELDPGSETAVVARQASEALSKGYPNQDAALAEDLVSLQRDLPRLERRASPDAMAAIEAAIEYRGILGDKTEVHFEIELARLDESARLANEEVERCEQDVQRLTNARDAFQSALRNAQVAATAIPKLKQIDAFVRDGGPSFMTGAPAEQQKLDAAHKTAQARKAFRFDLAEYFVKSGDRRPREIEERLKVIEPERDHIVNVLIPEIEASLSVLGEQTQTLVVVATNIDNFVHDLRRKFREVSAARCAPQDVDPEALTAHPLLQAMRAVRRADTALEAGNAVLALRGLIDEIDTAVLRHGVETAQRSCDRAQAQLSSEIDRVKGDSAISMSEYIRIGLERGKDDIAELARMIAATEESYGKSMAANETARRHLDDEWSNIGAWLEIFTRRLPGNFETMRAVFKPSRDAVSGEILSAGFDITARIADTNDVRAVLTGIVDKVEKAEKGLEALGDVDVRKAQYDRDMRRDIREEFYRNVIIEPRIKVCIPSISRRPLKLEKNMVSSGQGVAMTLLWIVKMADYVTERELQMQNVSSAQRKRARRLRTSFVFIDGAFSHLSDKRLITDALDGVKRTRGKFQLIITGHDANYKNDFAYFPSYIVGREIGGNLMYAESETRKLLEPEAVGAHAGVMELASWQKVPETLA
ncbi:hypothetical protein [Paraburkholderia adhaesiva]|uniref:hypothetical protein n=1 Tax=Paraburkholderia adhaesiva TaxID=2883244 RepID=UPI001F3116B5|nr:hypothetical protein [Paraburkholderia adhaesiva]